MRKGPTYTFHRCLGRGGFGEVYLATRHGGEEGIDKRVAVKVLRPDLPNADTALARLKDEGRMLAVLVHPSVVNVIELTRLRGRIALVTEYIEGIDLSRFCQPKHLLPSRVLLLAVSEVAGALDAAWNTVSPVTGKPLHLVHRDIKPENVRLSRHGEAKLLDFGIARSTEVGREARTATGNMPFTPGYTAPEAFVALKQGHPTDVFALGATMFRCVVGERFYEGVRLTEQAGLSSSPDRYAEFLDDRLLRLPPVHREVEPLLRRALAYDLDARPSAAELQTACETIADELGGPTLRRWAREVKLPEERTVTGASLTGLTLSEDRPEDSVAFVRPGAVPASPPSVPPPVPEGLVPVEPVVASMSLDRRVVPRPAGPSRVRLGWLAALGVGLVVGAALVGLVAVVLLATGVWMWG